MRFIGNIIWLIFGGLATAVEYIVASLPFLISIIGIPFGLQTLKLGMLALWPFGSQVVENESSSGCLSLIMNIIWIIFGGIEIALAHIVLGLAFCITIIGIPFGIQHFKLSLLALVPFGKEIVSK
jgi:uncharacterized membrane protein YccF (DUF307 family)